MSAKRHINGQEAKQFALKLHNEIMDKAKEIGIEEEVVDYR